ncbi:DHHA1 domain-containing protein [Acidobacteriota bacterium]
MTETTKRLYYNNPYQVEFEAMVIGRELHQDRPALILDQTCFYPESGGQPADRGSINGVEVVDVVEDQDEILHVLRDEVVADKVRGIIDWKTRFDHMQQHSGQHILSQCFHALFDAKTVSFHLGKSASTVEIEMKDITENEVEKVESLANEVVFQNEEICTYITPKEMVKTVPLRKPSQKDGNIRVVQISDFDYSACGGTHPQKTGEIGLIKIIKWDRIRGNLRFEFVCGQRALSDYSLRNRILREVAIRFTVGEGNVMTSIDRLFAEHKDLKKKYRKLQDDLIRYEALEIIQKADTKIIVQTYTDKSPDQLRNLSLNIIRSGEYVTLFGTKLEGRVHLILACSESLGIDMRELIPLVSPLIEGKGGGRSTLIELAGTKSENLQAALDKAAQTIGVRL